MKKYKLFNKILILIMIAIGLFFVINNLVDGKTDRLVNQLSLFLVILIPYIIEKFAKVKFTDSFKTLYFVFIMFAMVFGVVFNLYNTEGFEWYDKFMHGISGIATSILGTIVFFSLNKNNKLNKLFFIIFILSFSMLIAAGWEFFEFTADQIMKTNVQHHLETGVNDTMLDMIYAFGGSILFIVWYCIKSAKETIDFKSLQIKKG